MFSLYTYLEENDAYLKPREAEKMTRTLLAQTRDKFPNIFGGSDSNLKNYLIYKFENYIFEKITYDTV